MIYSWVNLTYPPESGLPIFRYGFTFLHGVLSYQKNKHISDNPLHPYYDILGGQDYFSLRIPIQKCFRKQLTWLRLTLVLA
jgi:hypothetical protein